MVEHVVREAGRLGVLCLGVKPVARNGDAVGFFHRCGFRVLGHIHMFMWLGEPAPGRWKRGPRLFGRSFEY